MGFLFNTYSEHEYKFGPKCLLLTALSWSATSLGFKPLPILDKETGAKSANAFTAVL